jgi:predicted nuclease of predicted toxin-antitoxin system
MWKKLLDLSKQDESELHGMRKAKLYADEDIEEKVVERFRDNGVNIKSARELGHRGKPDSFHAALAYKEKRFLLTKNAKHFMNDKIVPFQMVHGIIAIEGDMSDTQSYIKALVRSLVLILMEKHIWD